MPSGESNEQAEAAAFMIAELTKGSPLFFKRIAEFT